MMPSPTTVITISGFTKSPADTRQRTLRRAARNLAAPQAASRSVFAPNSGPRQDDDAMPGFADRNPHIRGITPHRDAQQFAIDLAIVVLDADDRADRHGAIVQSSHNKQRMELMMYGR